MDYYHTNWAGQHPWYHQRQDKRGPLRLRLRMAKVDQVSRDLAGVGEMLLALAFRAYRKPLALLETTSTTADRPERPEIGALQE